MAAQTRDRRCVRCDDVLDSSGVCPCVVFVIDALSTSLDIALDAAHNSHDGVGQHGGIVVKIYDREVDGQ